MNGTQTVAHTAPANTNWHKVICVDFSRTVAAAVTATCGVMYGYTAAVANFAAKNHKYVIGGVIVSALVYKYYTNKYEQTRIELNATGNHSGNDSLGAFTRDSMDNISRINIDVMGRLMGNFQIYDLTRALDERTPVYPGDPEFKREELCAIDNTCSFTMQHLHFCNHAGTHIDFPAHVIAGAKTSAGFSMQDFIGNCTIVDYPSISQSDTVSEKHLNEITPQGFVFFKNARCLSEKVVKFLIEKEVRLVGIDSLSVDAVDSHSLPIHNALLQRNILIVENLFLDNAPCGSCFVVVAPLNVTNIDGAPVRVVMWRE